MKKIFIFALMTMTASSSFAIGDFLKCINGSVNVVTHQYINDNNLRLSASFMAEDKGPFHAIVQKKSTSEQITFTGKTADGRDMKLEVKSDDTLVKRGDTLTGTLTIDGSIEKGFVCYEAGAFEM
jgi:hypothetical protein